MIEVKELTGLWHGVLSKLEKKITPYAFRNWFKGSTEILSVTKTQLEIGVANGTYRNVIRNKFGTQLKACCEAHLGRKLAITYTISGQLGSQLAKHCPVKEAPKAATAKTAGGSSMSSRSIASFHFKRRVKKISRDDVLVGGFNKIAASAVESIINSDKGCPNPLFIYGESGMGKTYLLQMIYTEIRKQEEDPRTVRFTTCEAFMNDYISSLQCGAIGDFRKYFRNADVFLLDDVHFLAEGGKNRTREEFYHTLNELLDAGTQVVITCDKHPTTVKQLGSRLVKRLMGGMWVQLTRPNTNMRLEILKAARGGSDIPDNVLEHIAEGYNGCIRELVGALTTVEKYCKYAGEPCSLDLVKQALGREAHQPAEPTVTIRNIVDEVCRHFDIKTSVLLSESRTRPVSKARHIAVYLCKAYIKDISLAKLAATFRNSRPAILYAGNKITRAIKNKDKSTQAAIKKISAAIEAKY